MEEAPAAWIFRFYPYDLDFKQTIVNTLNSKKSEKNTMKMYLLSNSGNSYRTIDQSTKYFQQKLSVLFFDFIKKNPKFSNKMRPWKKCTTTASDVKCLWRTKQKWSGSMMRVGNFWHRFVLCIRLSIRFDARQSPIHSQYRPQANDASILCTNINSHAHNTATNRFENSIQ